MNTSMSSGNGVKLILAGRTPVTSIFALKSVLALMISNL